MWFLDDWMNESVKKTVSSAACLSPFISDQFRQAYELSMLSFYPLRFCTASQQVRNPSYP